MKKIEYLIELAKKDKIFTMHDRMLVYFHEAIWTDECYVSDLAYEAYKEKIEKFEEVLNSEV